MVERESDVVVRKSAEAEASASLAAVLSGVEALRSDLATLCDCVSGSDDALRYPRRAMVHALPGGSVVQPWSTSMRDWQPCRVDFGEQRERRGARWLAADDEPDSQRARGFEAHTTALPGQHTYKQAPSKL